MIRPLVEAVAARAKALLPALAVEDFPGDAEHYRLLHPRGAVLVIYTGSDFGRPSPLLLGVQDRGMKVDLVLQIRNLAKAQGAYEALEVLRKGFTGWEVPGFLPAYPTRDAFRGAQEGVFQYVITIFFPTRVAQEAPVEPVATEPLQFTLHDEP